MDFESKDTLKKIEKHLKALVYFTSLKMVKQMADSGAFTEENGFNMDKANNNMKILLEKAYKNNGIEI